MSNKHIIRKTQDYDRMVGDRVSPLNIKPRLIHLKKYMKKGSCD